MMASSSADHLLCLLAGWSDPGVRVDMLRRALGRDAGAIGLEPWACCWRPGEAGVMVVCGTGAYWVCWDGGDVPSSELKADTSALMSTLGWLPFEVFSETASVWDLGMRWTSKWLMPRWLGEERSA